MGNPWVQSLPYHESAADTPGFIQNKIYKHFQKKSEVLFDWSNGNIPRPPFDYHSCLETLIPASLVVDGLC